MLPIKLFEKSIKIETLVSVNLKSDVCDILVKRSMSDCLTLTVYYHPIVENHFDLEKTQTLGTFRADTAHQTIFYELNSDELENIFLDEIDDIPKTEIIVELPINTKLYVDTIHSDIKIADISIEFQINTVNGDVLVENSGHGSIESINGFIKLANISDNFDIKTVNGNTHIKKGAGGVLNITSDNGDIYTKEMNYHKISCKTQNGNIFSEMSNGETDFMELISEQGDLKFVAANGKFNSVLMSSENGDTMISIPFDRLINLDLTTENGEIEANINTEHANEEIIDTDRVYINCGEDLPNIQANLINGDISLKNTDNTISKIVEKGHQVAELIIDKIEESHTVETVFDLIEDTQKKIHDSIEKVEKKVHSHEIQDKIKHFIDDKIVPYMKKGCAFTKEKTSLYFDKIKNRPNSIKKNLPKQNETYQESVLKILEMIEKKNINVDEAERLIKTIKN